MSDPHPVPVALENRLMSHGIYVTDCEPLDPGDNGSSRYADGTGLALEYETVAASPTVETEEVGAVVRALLAVADERDWTPGRLEVTSRGTDGTARGAWHVKRAWFDALGADLDQVAFSRRVLETRRPVEDE